MKQRRSGLARTIPRTNLEHLLLCSLCKENVPVFGLHQQESMILINFSCNCRTSFPAPPLDLYLKIMKEQSSINTLHPRRRIIRKSNEKYCLNCKEWLCSCCLKKHKARFKYHTLIKQPAHLACKTHQKHFSHYCECGWGYFCYDCFEKMSPFHPLTPVRLKDMDKDYFKKNRGAFDDIMAMNREVTNSFLERLNQAEKTPEINKMKQIIQSSYKVNRIFNKDLKGLIKCFEVTLLALRRHPMPQLVNMISILKVNEAEIELEGTSIEADFAVLKKYLLNNFILVQKKVKTKVETLQGHKDIIWNIIRLRDENLASSSRDTTIKIWHSIQYTCISTLTGNTGSVRALLQLSNGSLLSGAADESIRVWDLKTFTCQATLIGHFNWINCLTELSTGRIVSGSDDAKLKVWLVSTSECIQTLKGHKSFVNCVRELTDGRVASCSTDNTINLWNLDTEEKKNLARSFRGHMELCAIA